MRNARRAQFLINGLTDLSNRSAYELEVRGRSARKTTQAGRNLARSRSPELYRNDGPRGGGDYRRTRSPPARGYNDLYRGRVSHRSRPEIDREDPQITQMISQAFDQLTLTRDRFSKTDTRVLDTEGRITNTKNSLGANQRLNHPVHSDDLRAQFSADTAQMNQRFEATLSEIWQSFDDHIKTLFESVAQRQRPSHSFPHISERQRQLARAAWGAHRQPTTSNESGAPMAEKDLIQKMRNATLDDAE